jgi:ATP-dependent Lon protease
LEDEIDEHDECAPPTPDSFFGKALDILCGEFNRLGTMKDRDRFVTEAKYALSLGTIRRSDWADAQKFVRLFAKLLSTFGRVDEELSSAIERVTGTAGSDEGKMTVLFNCICALPFGVTRMPCLDSARVAVHLDQSLFGMHRVKREIQNHLVLMAHAEGTPSPQPILLVGPPGTGKTAVAEVVASALQLPFFKTSRACACDTLFFRGSHYGWTASAPGFFSKTLMAAACENPVILLDEIDKAGGHGHGDVVDTLAEVFDPTQSRSFNDLFLTEVPIDLSRVLWIATANNLSQVPGYIADRCKVIRVQRYQEQERRAIITSYLPAQIRKQLALVFPVVVGDEVAQALAKGTESLREAKGALTDLIARELAGKTPGTVKKLVLKTWDPSVLLPPEKSRRSRPIGFMPPERNDQPGGREV